MTTLFDSAAPVKPTVNPTRTAQSESTASLGLAVPPDGEDQRLLGVQLPA